MTDRLQHERRKYVPEFDSSEVRVVLNDPEPTRVHLHPTEQHKRVVLHGEAPYPGFEVLNGFEPITRADTRTILMPVAPLSLSV